MKTIKDEWLTMTQIVKMMGGFFSRETLRKRAQRGNAPFYMRRIGARYYARREDVEKYIKDISSSGNEKHEKNIKQPLTINMERIKDEWLTTKQICKMIGGHFSPSTLCRRVQRGNAPFYIRRINGRYYARREDVEKYINDINRDNQKDYLQASKEINYLYDCKPRNFPLKATQIEIKAKRLNCIALINVDDFASTFGTNERALNFLGELYNPKKIKQYNDERKIPSLFVAEQNGFVVFAFVFCGFLEINALPVANYIFFKTNKFREYINDWLNN